MITFEAIKEKLNQLEVCDKPLYDMEKHVSDITRDINEAALREGIITKKEMFDDYHCVLYIYDRVAHQFNFMFRGCVLFSIKLKLSKHYDKGGYRWIWYVKGFYEITNIRELWEQNENDKKHYHFVRFKTLEEEIRESIEGVREMLALTALKKEKAKKLLKQLLKEYDYNEISSILNYLRGNMYTLYHEILEEKK